MPGTSVANTLLIGQHVDGVILSILRDVSQRRACMPPRHRLAALGIRGRRDLQQAFCNDVYGYYGYYGHKTHKNGRADRNYSGWSICTLDFRLD